MFQNFIKSESGAVTVDWVVLTAALVGLGLAVMAVISTGIEDLTGEIQDELAAANPGDNPFGGDAVIGRGDLLAD